MNNLAYLSVVEKIHADFAENYGSVKRIPIPGDKNHLTIYGPEQAYKFMYENIIMPMHNDVETRSMLREKHRSYKMVARRSNSKKNQSAIRVKKESTKKINLFHTVGDKVMMRPHTITNGDVAALSGKILNFFKK